jgi:hypothetical protein
MQKRQFTSPKAGIGGGIFFIALGLIVILAGGSFNAETGIAGAVGAPFWLMGVGLFFAGAIFIIMAIRQSRS